MDNIIKTIFGRLSIESLPIHEPIVVGTFRCLAGGGIAVQALMT